MDGFDPEAFTWPFQLTKSLHRNLYPLLDPANPELSAEGKNVIITGASQGIGSAIAEAWCIAKAKGVLLTSRKIEDLEKVADRIRSRSPATRVVVHAADLRSEDSVKELYKKASTELGVIDVLINNAGALTAGVIGEVEPSQWWNDFEVNVKGFYFMNHYFLKQGGGKGTTIGLNSGAVGLVYPGTSSYCCSKLAQGRVTEFIQLEYPELRAFSLLPGLATTKMTLPSHLPYAKDETMLSGGLSLFLATPRADWLKGQTISINWDIEEMESHKEELQNGQLIRLGWLGAKFGKGGHPWRADPAAE